MCCEYVYHEVLARYTCTSIIAIEKHCKSMLSTCTHIQLTRFLELKQRLFSCPVSSAVSIGISCVMSSVVKPDFSKSSSDHMVQLITGVYAIPLQYSMPKQQTPNCTLYNAYN